MANREKTTIEEQLKEIGLKLKELRVEKGYKSYETFALDNNLDRKQYWRMEKGTNITLKSLIKILNIYNMTLSDFFLRKN